LHGDALAYGARFVDQDLVVDGDLVTARTGKHCHLLARQIIEMLASRNRATARLGNGSQLVAAHL
jgi:protease I